MKKKKKAKALLSLAKKRSGTERRKALLAMAGHKCFMCGFKEWWALEFHHVGKKRFTLNSRTLGLIADDKLILSEFKSCILLCSNCHKGIHYGGLKQKLDEALEQGKIVDHSDSYSI